MAACSIEDVLAKAAAAEAGKLQSIAVLKELDVEFDVGNLLALDKNAVNSRDLKQPDNGACLRALARDNTQLLINELWKHPSQRVEGVLVLKLPDTSTPLPREKRAPKPRPPTRWEQFARLKGIQRKRKTSLVWDEVHKAWKRRWGYGRARDDTKEWLIEVPELAHPSEDQFAKRKQAKKERVAKNEFNRLKNIARGQKLKVPGVGLAPTGQQSKAELAKAVHVARSSTASVGKFQERLPKEKPLRNTGKRRQFRSVIGDFAGEKQRQLEMLKAMASKRPRLDITKAVNRQLREEDGEALQKKKGRKGNAPGKGRRSAPSGKGKGKGKGKGMGMGKGKGKGMGMGKGKGKGMGKASASKGKGRKPAMKQGKR